MCRAAAARLAGRQSWSKPARSSLHETVEFLRPLVRRVALEPDHLDHAAALRRRRLLVQADKIVFARGCSGAGRAFRGGSRSGCNASPALRPKYCRPPRRPPEATRRPNPPAPAHGGPDGPSGHTRGQGLTGCRAPIPDPPALTLDRQGSILSSRSLQATETEKNATSGCCSDQIGGDHGGIPLSCPSARRLRESVYAPHWMGARQVLITSFRHTAHRGCSEAREIPLGGHALDGSQ